MCERDGVRWRGRVTFTSNGTHLMLICVSRWDALSTNSAFGVSVSTDVGIHTDLKERKKKKRQKIKLKKQDDSKGRPET